jgi:chaperone required for assembly of F1-ATPase
VDGLNAWERESFVYAVENARSVLVAMALCEGHINADTAFFLANLETEF